ncbi:HAD family hydrolase [Stenotrophobium rhamnosiphilum]|uniref:HAD-IB family hydrolase n=1 Tax=Stenotrophobium rhamnosiphilum TaxID=2029166 RepID=A0A2T5MBH5_9GAMM|nr:HAD family hydrolase [Stenotrophobium rhamnosiphilum]PTU29084.1 HAD-IB family hydrolase [Stenotrophobium rhamnosiphilum]
MNLAIFDLDNTLLAGDSDYLWGQFLVEQGLVDGSSYEEANHRFYDQYKAGTLDIYEFCAFSMGPLTQYEPAQLYAWRAQFVREKIEPIVAAGTPALLERHRAQGDRLLIMTATNRFITEPIAELLNIGDLIATDPEMKDGRYTGRVAGIPNFQDGKVQRLELWRAEQTEKFAHTYFYSDSRNDIPLLLKADTAVAVDADEVLLAEATKRGWPVITLRGPQPD